MIISDRSFGCRVLCSLTHICSCNFCNCGSVLLYEWPWRPAASDLCRSMKGRDPWTDPLPCMIPPLSLRLSDAIDHPCDRLSRQSIWTLDRAVYVPLLWSVFAMSQNPRSSSMQACRTKANQALRGCMGEQAEPARDLDWV